MIPGRRAATSRLAGRVLLAGGLFLPTAALPAETTSDTSRRDPAQAAPGTPRSDPADPASGKPSKATTEAVIAHYEFEIDAPEELRGLIERQTLIGRWRYRREYQPEQFDALFDKLREEVEVILRSQGYFDFEVNTSGDSRKVRVEVNAGARTTVNRVSLKLNGPVNEVPELEKRLRDRWLLAEGTFYNTGNWESSKRQMIDSMRQAGFLRARLIRSRAIADVANTTVALEVEIDSGERVAFGPLVVSGLSRYSEKIVEDLKPFNTGDPYDFDLLLLFQTRLRDAGYFSAAYVLVDQQALDRDPALLQAPLKVELTERESKRVVTGIGYSTDQGPRAQIGLQHRDLLHRGWQLDSGVMIEQLRQRLYANVRTPTNSTGHHIAFGGRAERQDIQNEQVYRNTIFIGRGKRLNHLDSFTSLQYQTERRTIESSPGVNTVDDRRALTLGYSWNYRLLDSRIDPRAGYTVSAQFSGALKGVASDASFGRIYTRAMRFQPLDSENPSKSGILIGLLEIGHVFSNSRSDVPTENLFRAGGAQSLRGYGYQAIGVTEGEAIVGGRALAIASLEYQHPVANATWLAGFVDVGNAVDRFSDFKPLWGYGVGVRWRTPIGPINLDAAYGDAARRWRLHFSVGYTF